MPTLPLHPVRRIARVLVACHAAAGVLACTWTATATESLPELLAQVAANARADPPVRADVRIDCGEGCAAAGRPAIFVARGDALYVEVKDGQRALLRPERILVARDGAPVEAAVGDAFADTDLLLEDLVPFTAASLKVPQISDDGPAGVVVTSAPTGSSTYALLVHTIDRERHAIVRTLYYRDLINNLSKTRSNRELARAGGGWRPGTIVAETLRRATKTTLTLAWRDVPDAPANLFEPAGLAKPSGLVFP
ncbi:MAG TPA: hypothetical protein VKA21_06660 [Candidatus Binatia bacterium]|nr:hypothetical protein [Candidatus Binatia bacterium]